MMPLSQDKRGRLHTALAYKSRLNDKIDKGEYLTETVKCFCGADNYTVLSEVDRDLLNHRNVVCNECALVYANPRLTKESYSKFYNDEYRNINYPSGSDNPKHDMDYHWTREYEKGEIIKQLLVDFDIDEPKIVVDWGCFVGGTLSAFTSAKTYGIEIAEVASNYAKSKGHAVVNSITELEALGVKADLIIMQDFIEHLTDLNEVEKIKKILKPGGYIYIYTPGFFRFSVKSLFQVAHTYQFCSSTLEYVMSKLGFREIYIDEEVVAIYQNLPCDERRKPVEWAEHIKDQVFKPDSLRKMPRFRGVCKFTKKQLHENVALNLSEKAPDLYELTGKQSGDLIIIGGGASVDNQVEQIKELQINGSPLMVIARMYPWCAKNGIVPDYVVSLDCSEEQEKSFTNIQPNVTYLLASVTRPSIFKMLSKEKRYVFDTHESNKYHNFRHKNGYEVCTVINGCGSVTITCISLGMNLGFKDFHMFGLDLMILDKNHTHAKDIAGTSLPQNFIEIEVNGKTIITTKSFVDFANQTLDLVSAGHEDGLLKSIKFYGESLLNYMWDGKWHEEEVAV